MDKSPPRRHLRPFSTPEILKLEKLLEERSPNQYDEKFYKELTDEFNRAGVTTDALNIDVEQVRGWFTSMKGDHVREADSVRAGSKELITASDSSSRGSKESVVAPDSFSGGLEELIVTPDAKVSNNASERATDMPKEEEEEVAEDEWEFEARSAREGAWYDVGTFLTYRVNSAGDPEVRVRFQGFGPDQDEWVDVKTAVRERSIPLENFDCQMVEIGDLVLCFRETSDLAAHYDAHVVEVQRREHDENGCSCQFLVRYDDDKVEETVDQKGLCRRPVHKSANGCITNG